MSAPAAAKSTPEQKCQSGKNRAAGAYAKCLQGAEATLVSSSKATKLDSYNKAIAKCATTFGNKWQGLINAANKAGATCPDSPLTNAQFKTVIDEHSENMTTALNGGGLQDCPSDLLSCQSDLAACLANTLPADRVLQTGETGCYDPSGSGAGVSCSGTGQDGDLQTGQVRSYTDNGDGTITDNQTGLTWEKKSDDGTINDQDNLYNWSDAFSVFIGGLNVANFVGHNDWRLPNRFELESLVDLGLNDPSVDAAFNTSCTGSTVTTGSCTAFDVYYWSSSVVTATPAFAWSVGFNNGGVNFSSIQFDTNHVRAVRGP